MMAIHPAQVAAINAAFTPTEDEIAAARAIVDAFAAAPGDPEADTASEPSQPSSEAQSPEAGDARTRLRGLPTRR